LAFLRGGSELSYISITYIYIIYIIQQLSPTALSLTA
jgi:hypothetical protein